MYHVEAAIRDFEQAELQLAQQERVENLELAWDYCPHNLKVTKIYAHKKLVTFDMDEESITSQTNFLSQFCLTAGKYDKGIIVKVEILAANVLIVDSNLNEQDLLEEVKMGFLPF